MYFIQGFNTVQIEKALNICNSYISMIVRGLRYQQHLNKFLTRNKEKIRQSAAKPQ